MDQVLFDRVHHVAPPSFYGSWQQTNRTPALETGFVLKLSPQAMEPQDRSRVWRFVLVPGWRDLSTICNCWHFEQSLVQKSVFILFVISQQTWAVWTNPSTWFPTSAQMDQCFCSWRSSRPQWLTDYIEPSDSLADHFSCWSDFLEEGRPSLIKLTLETHQTVCWFLYHGECLSCGRSVLEMHHRHIWIHPQEAKTSGQHAKTISVTKTDRGYKTQNTP